MNRKYKVGDKPWTITREYGEVHVERCTIESISTKGEQPYYKMEEGCSFWRYERDLFNNKKDAQKACEEINKQILEQRALQEKANKFWESIKEKRYLPDGIYDVTDIPFYQLEEDDKAEKLDETKSFIESNPDYTVAHAYETYTIFILARKPNKLKGHSIGSGFNYGSTNIIKDCPKDILILAEDD